MTLLDLSRVNTLLLLSASVVGFLTTVKRDFLTRLVSHSSAVSVTGGIDSRELKKPSADGVMLRDFLAVSGAGDDDTRRFSDKEVAM